MSMSVTQRVQPEATYVSFVGPLLNKYAQVPFARNNIEAAWIMNHSQMKSLWCSTYTRSRVDQMIQEYGGEIITLYAEGLSFDWFEFEQLRKKIKDQNTITLEL